jgi:hypothetical protein
MLLVSLFHYITVQEKEVKKEMNFPPLPFLLQRYPFH